MHGQLKNKQQGVSLVGLIFVLAILAGIAIVAMQVIPTVSEYMAIKNAIVTAKDTGTSPAEIRSIFDKHADVAYITSITGKDLELSKTDRGMDVSFAYEKRIPLGGPVSLLIEYAGTTAKAQKPLKADGA